MTYDLHQVDKSNLLPLRDTLLTALREYHSGPRTIVVQLSLAIVGLALQLPAWENVVQNMIDSFGRNPATVPTLLEFLTILPEEVNSNTRIPISVGIIRSGAYRSISLFIRMANSERDRPFFWLQILNKYWNFCRCTHRRAVRS